MEKRDSINKLIKENVDEIGVFVTKISRLIYNEGGVRAVKEVVLSDKYVVEYERLTLPQKMFVYYWATENELLEECILLFKNNEE